MKTKQNYKQNNTNCQKHLTELLKIKWKRKKIILNINKINNTNVTLIYGYYLLAV